MDTYQISILTRRVSIPMVKIGGNIQQVLMDALSEMEGKCGEEGYIKRGSIRLFNYSCGMIKGTNVIVQVVFECQVSNPIPNQEFECIVEHNTRAGIKARLREKGDSPFVVFLARDHHYMIPHFSDIKENDIIHVKVLGQRFEIHDPKISIIALLIPTESSETVPTELSETTALEMGGKRMHNLPDILVFSTTLGADKLPGKGSHEHVSNDYPVLSKIVKWRQLLSPFDIREFTCHGLPEHGIVFKEDTKWNTLEHFNQACKVFSQDPALAYTFCVGGKHGQSAHNLESKCKEIKADNWDAIREEVMYTGAKAKFDQHPSYMDLLRATSPAQLMYSSRGELSRYKHYEHLREL